MQFDEILADLHKKKYYPIYFLEGEEPYYIDQITDYIARHVLTDAEKGFNQAVLYGKDTDVNTIITYARRFPMMSSHQVLIVKEAQNIKKIEDLEPYVKAPLASTILVINYKYKNIDKRKSFAKMLTRNAVYFDSKALRDYQIPGWIVSYLKNRGYSIGQQAAALLSEYLGTSLSKVSNELDKLIISLPAGSNISPEIIEKNIGISKEYNVFELQKALGSKDVMKVMRIISYFGDNPSKNPVTPTIISLFNYFSKLLKYHFTENKSESNLATALQISPYFVKEYATASKNYSIRKLVEIVEILREYDMKAKGWSNVSASPADLQREMIYRILH